MSTAISDSSSSAEPATRRGLSPIAIRIFAFLAALALSVAGVFNGVVAATAYLSGDLVGAVGEGAKRAAADPTPENPEALVTKKDLHGVAESAGDFALRAKLVALGIGLVAAAQLLCAELIRRRYRSKATPVILGVAAAGEIAMAIILTPTILTAIGLVACAGGVAIWTQFRNTAEPLTA